VGKPKEQAMNLRDKIFAADDVESRELFISDWDVTILMRGMTAKDRLDLMDRAFNQDTGRVDLKVMYPELVVACSFDPETKEPIFTEEDKADLLSKSSAALEKVAEVALELSGMGSDVQDAAGKVSSPILKEDSSSS
jgi:hypothetical protein